MSSVRFGWIQAVPAHARPGPSCTRSAQAPSPSAPPLRARRRRFRCRRRRRRRRPARTRATDDTTQIGQNQTECLEPHSPSWCQHLVLRHSPACQPRVPAPPIPPPPAHSPTPRPTSLPEPRRPLTVARSLNRGGRRMPPRWLRRVPEAASACSIGSRPRQLLSACAAWRLTHAASLTPSPAPRTRMVSASRSAAHSLPCRWPPSPPSVHRPHWLLFEVRRAQPRLAHSTSAEDDPVFSMSDLSQAVG